MIESDGWKVATKQQTLAGFEKCGKTTRRAQFLVEMKQVLPWAQLCALNELAYSKGGSGEGVGMFRPVPRPQWAFASFAQESYRWLGPCLVEAQH